MTNEHLPPDPSLVEPWKDTQFGLLLLPVSPLLAGAFLLRGMWQTWRHYGQEIVASVLNRGFALMAGWIIITSVLAADKQAAFLGMFNFLPFFAFFATASTFIKTPAQLRRIAWILVLGSVPVVIIGWGQLFWGWTGPVKLGAVINWPIQPLGNPPGRMASVFDYANVLASYFLVTFILGVGLWCESFFSLKSLMGVPEHREMVRDPRDPRIVRTLNLRAAEEPSRAWQRLGFLSLTVLGNGVALILTNSRNAWAIACVAGIAFAVYLGWRSLVAAFSIAVGGVAWSAFGPDPVRLWLRNIVPAYFWARLTDELYPDRPLASLRSTQWQFAWQMALDRPFTGWGLRNFTPAYEAKMQFWLGHPHNLFLMLAAETGIPGVLLLSGLVAWVLGHSIIRLRHWQVPTSTHDNIIPFQEDKLIFFTYLVAFTACTLFHILDVTIFDSRINIIGWLLLAAIWGVTRK
ncbi:O-antigen ligase [[Phormidium] sp. ETS-05]|uniref:O-antigen ligase family protein n=1 Tax=[Phormidium] sp. ETS-05 TaxID=222819 RepID=UPI0018EF144D|nr:O-antigen ligase family protein [[Phormidium] sp. ETS-05]